MTEASDEKIFQSIMDAIEARENIDINGGDDVDNTGVAIEPRLTRREVLKAVSTISKYIIDELDDPVSCKIEGLLWSFNQQLRLDESVRGHQFSSQPRGPSLPRIRTIVRFSAPALGSDRSTHSRSETPSSPPDTPHSSASYLSAMDSDEQRRRLSGASPNFFILRSQHSLASIQSTVTNEEANS